MDFWNRLIGGSGSSSSTPTKAPAPLTAQQRLAKFKRLWQTLLHSWRNAREGDQNAQDLLRSYIKRMTDMLIEEEKKPERVCMNFCFEGQVFIALSKIGQTGSTGVIREVISLFATLIENEDEMFLGNEVFAQSLISFLETSQTKRQPAFEEELVEILFNIAAKLRLSPGILQVWFTKGSESDEENFDSLEPRQQFAGISSKEEFPLFYLLIEYVHQEGRIGDFARTGLLYIIEATSSTADLAKWLVQSDLATLMASGLGALYSQLSRKLVISYPEGDPPPILALSDFAPKPPPYGVEVSTSPEFKTHLDTFLSYLVFWQDVLEHCRAADVKHTLLDHFQVLFLQQLLYPSLLESSDIDGGSSVAVLTYVRVILDTLEHADMIHLILTYLMNLPEMPEPLPSKRDKQSRRQSLDLLSKMTKTQVQDIIDTENPTPALYSLADLIITSLGSRSQQTVSATLRLVSTILRKHYPYAMNTLIKIVPISSGTPARTIGAHNKEIDMLFNLVTSISAENNAAQSYDDHLKDCSILLEAHPCTAKYLDLKSPTNTSDPLPNHLSKMHTHTLSLHDPLLRLLLGLLTSFFSNSVETNLVLTSVLIDLSACAFMRPEGWLFHDPATYTYKPSSVASSTPSTDASDSEGEDYDNSSDFFATKQEQLREAILRCRREPIFPKETRPPVLAALEGLIDELNAYRQDIPDLDAQLAERRRAFQVSESLSEAIFSTGQATPVALDPFNPRSLVTPSRTPRVASMSFLGGSTDSTPQRSTSPANTQRIKILRPGQKGVHLPPPPEEPVSGAQTPDGASTPQRKQAQEDNGFSVSHLLTNVCILQEFIIELVALMQTRAALYGDVSCA